MNQARNFEADSMFVVPRAEKVQKCQKKQKYETRVLFLFLREVLVFHFFTSYMILSWEIFFLNQNHVFFHEGHDFNDRRDLFMAVVQRGSKGIASHITSFLRALTLYHVHREGTKGGGANHFHRH